MTKIACVIPWMSPFIWAASMPAYLNLRIPAGLEHRWFMANGWCSARRKTTGVELAKAWGADLILFTDADQVVEPDALERLYAHHCAGRTPVCALQPSRSYLPGLMQKPYQPVCWDEDAKPFTPDKVQIVKHGPLGCFLIPMAIFDALPRPWFSERFDPVTMARLSSLDPHFTRKLWDNKMPMWVDPGIRSTHLHPMEIDWTFQDRFDDLIVEKEPCPEKL